jgi:hypothetical protein
MNNAN